MDYSLQDQVIVITGASTGFGRGIAVSLARRGAKIVVADLVEEAATGNFDEGTDKTTAAFIESEGGTASFVRCDVTEDLDVEGAVAFAVRTYGRLDGFVNNAGVYRGGPFHEISLDDFDFCMSVLVRGTWLGCQSAVRQFLAQGSGGSIVNIVSTAGLRGHPGQACYNTAKGAQANLTRALAVEYARQGIRVNGVCPTYIKSAMSRAAVEDPTFGAVIANTVPAGKWGEIGDVVNATAFLMAPESSFITGVLLPVDGGETAGAVPA